MKLTGLISAFIRKLWFSFAVILVASALVISSVRVGLPYANHFKPQITQWFTQQFNQAIAIRDLSADWQGAGPVVQLEGFEFLIEPDANAPVVVNIDQVNLELDFWQSLLQQSPVVRNFVLDGVRVEIDLAQMRAAERAGSEIAVVELFETIFLKQFQRFDVQNSLVTIITPQGDSHDITVHQLKWFNQASDHQGVGKFSLEGIEAEKLAFILDLKDVGDDKYDGQFYVSADGIDFASWLRPYVAKNARNLQSKLRFEAWVDIQQSHFDSILFNIDPSELTWYLGKKKHKLELVSGQLQARLDQNIPQLYLYDFSFAQGDKLWGGLNVQGEQRQGSWRIYAREINLAPLKPLLALTSFSEQIDKFANALITEPHIDNLHLKLNADDSWLFSAQVEELSWQGISDLPDFNNLSAKVKGQNGLITMDWQLPKQDILWPSLYPDTLSQMSVNMHSYIRYPVANKNKIKLANQPTSWQFYAPNVAVNTENEQISGQFSLNMHSGLSPELAVFLNIPKLTISQVKPWLPASLLGKETHAYLDRALVSGDVLGGQLIFQGHLNDFPYKQAQGIFHTRVHTNKVNFAFQPDWPSLTETQLQLDFKNSALFMQSEQARLLDVSVSKVQAYIDDLGSKQALLTINADASATGKAATEVMLKGSLADSVGKTLQEVSVQGLVNTNLQLTIPLLKPEALNASGSVLFAGNQVLINPTGFQFEHVNGLLEFDMDKLSSKKMTFDWGPVPYQIDLASQQQDDGYQVNIDLRGKWPLEAILTHRGLLSLADRVKGNADIDGHLAMSFAKNKFDYRLDVATDLHGVRLQLPKPFDKKAQHLQLTNLTISGDQDSSLFELTSGENIHFNAVLPHQDKKFSRAYLVLGQNVLSAPATGFNIALHLPQANLQEYIELITLVQSDFSKLPSSDDSVIGLPQRIRGGIQELAVGPLNWRHLSFDINKATSLWSTQIQSQQFNGLINIHDDISEKGIDIFAETFVIETTKGLQADNPLTKAEIKQIFDAIPPIKLSCKVCRLDQKQLGEINAEIARTSPKDIALKSFTMRYRGNKVDATGLWRIDDKLNSLSKLQGSISSSDFGWWLRDYQLTSAIRDSSIDAQFQLNWNKSPVDLGYPDLNGTMNWKLGEGYLTEVSDKGARILSVLSLDSLVRKLKLDFRDVFSKGLFYNSMKGDIKLTNGVAYTGNTYMDGVAGNMEVTGSTNLVTQELNYQVRFSPKVTSSLPILIAWMVNPVTGIAALAIDQVIESADVISQIEFDISGTIESPVIVETARKSKAVKLNAAKGKANKTGASPAKPKQP
ncbi:YhdP family protein [Catenovulum agarivorans]|uniref:YhdP family protein n=1 Tax=Catenovulum agarivorans TaxID=1172192 RepID=UPI0003184795|nr:YhdP family protein [Catenovulum agarivorans]